ncbi:MAG: polysaccharide biosynthesis C-terminal domain-containing protein, partial [Lachnospiraceae bacterium]|nr:polysaccharide biosynthesis C-terminal domain-containing protein [Candidatus Equihabitans merdae]
MTTEPVPRLVTALAVPSIATMLVSSIYNMVDTAFVGTLGTSASGAIGVVFGYMAILQAIGFLCGQGTGSVMSRFMGQQNEAEANRYASTGFMLTFSLGTIVALLSLLFFEPLIYMLGSTDTIAPYAKIYVGFIIASAPFFTSSFTMNNLLRYEGKAKLGTMGMLTGSVLNIFGDFLLIFVFKMGIAGAGLSTAISQFISFCILLS